MKKLLIIGGCILILILFYGFLWGPLFPYCPVKSGFAEICLERSVIIYPKGTSLLSEYMSLDRLLEESEKRHNLTFKKPVRIIVCAKNGQYKRYSMGGGRACTIQTGTVIYISPKIQQATYPPRVEVQNDQLTLIRDPDRPYRDLTSFLQHELSHALIYQNTSLGKALKIKRWFEEGLAVYFGNAHHYYQGAEFKTLAVNQGFFFDLLDDKAEPEYIPDSIKYSFMYGAYAEFVSYLIDTYGLERVLDFAHEYIQDPDQEEELFNKFFEIGSQEVLNQFWQSL